MSCEQIAELLPDYLQGSLSEASRGQVERRLLRDARGTR